MKTWLAFVLLCALAAPTQAERKTPASADTVIATWPVSQANSGYRAGSSDGSRPDAPDAVLALVNAQLAQAAEPGQSRLYGLAQSALKPLIESDTNNPAIWLAWAQVLQHQHSFDEALAALQIVSKQQPENVNAQLLAARIHLIQGHPEAARSACLRLIGNADLLTASGCLLEVASFQGELEQSYAQLSLLLERQGLPEDERGPWLSQVLADMALRLGDPAAAERWLHQQPLDTATVNYLAQWADVQLSLGKPEQVLRQLQPVIEDSADVDDALLLRLALAEKALRGKQWQDQLHSRMSLREQRADSQHASELARYYLDINPQPQKALHWAQVNWQNTREYSDEKLLERARSVAQKPEQEARP